MRDLLRRVAAPGPQPGIEVLTDRVARRAVIIELAIVGVLTLGFSAVYAILSLIEAELTIGISNTPAALNPSQSSVVVIDMIRSLMSVTRLFAIAALGIYLLWRSGLVLRRIGIGRPDLRRDVPPGLALAAVIGLPGLALVAVARLLDLSAQIQPSETDGLWWRWFVLILAAIGNAAAEEIIIVAYFIVRLRQLGVGANTALAASALVRGAYHLYQGVGGGLGNIVMGLVYGRYYQLTNRVWPLVVGHAVIDIVAFIGYALLHKHLTWLL